MTTSLASLRGAGFLAYASEQAPQSQGRSVIATHLSGARDDRVGCHSEPFASCHFDPERSEGEESRAAQGRLREESFA
jgi:hypothetical protein